MSVHISGYGLDTDPHHPKAFCVKLSPTQAQDTSQALTLQMQTVTTAPDHADHNNSHNVFTATPTTTQYNQE
ncbi:hypothetical protein PM082_024460 [Marasmius tenuissimus]|nr:hypothetical protein PM082_024460 [Marasmius tenuissimus]